MEWTVFLLSGLIILAGMVVLHILWGALASSIAVDHSSYFEFC